MTRYGTFMKSETVSHQCTPQRTNEDMTPHSYTSAQHSGLMKIWPRIVTVHQCTAQRTNEDVTPHSYSLWCKQILSSWCVEEVTCHYTQPLGFTNADSNYHSCWLVIPILAVSTLESRSSKRSPDPFPYTERFSTGRKKPYCLNSTSCQVTFTDRDIFLPKVWQFTGMQEMISLVINV